MNEASALKMQALKARALGDFAEAGVLFWKAGLDHATCVTELSNPREIARHLEEAAGLFADAARCYLSSNKEAKTHVE